MSRRPHLDNGSLRVQRLRALAPRLLVYATLTVLCIAGLRAILAGPAEPIVRAAPLARTAPDVGATSFAEAFARAYLTWDAAQPERRELALTPFLDGSSDSEGGLRPADGTSQSVAWTSVAAVDRIGARTLVTVVAQTEERRMHLVVPVSRDADGLLRLAGYPALVGPPAVDRASALEAGPEQEVDDDGLALVAERAVRNYLARSHEDLLADLTADAMVSLPEQPLRLAGTEAVTWAVPGRRVALRVTAHDEAGTELTLRYELTVVLSDRWYVRAIHVDPTGGDTP